MNNYIEVTYIVYISLIGLGLCETSNFSTFVQCKSLVLYDAFIFHALFKLIRTMTMCLDQQLFDKI
jgi:hypothetical protein